MVSGMSDSEEGERKGGDMERERGHRLWLMSQLHGEKHRRENAERARDDAHAVIERAKADAWDEGYWLGINGHTGPGNPYRDRSNTTPTKKEAPRD